MNDRDLMRVDPAELDRGGTLPCGWYTRGEIFAAENERIFRKTWQYVGHVEQVARAGDFFTATLGDIPAVITRDDQGKIHAVANVCRHRASEVVLECSGNRRTLQCHYHGWTYNLDGTLRAAPRSSEQRSFPKDRLSLTTFAVQTWGPMIFVNPDPDAPPLASVIGDLPHLFGRAGVEMEKLKMMRRDVYEIAANWKIVIENFNECYHCPIAHPKFSELIDTDTYIADVSHEYFSTYHGPIIGVPGAAVDYATLWPTAMFTLSAKPHAMQVLRAWPIDPDHTRMTIDYYFTPDVSEAEIRDYVGLSDLVQREDMVLCESVHRGQRSAMVPRGHLMLSRESGIRHFQRLVYRFVAGA